jgi:hypothetical protein
MQGFQFKPPYFCWICGHGVELETCTTDEHGMPVHGQCFFLKMARANESMRLSVRKPSHSRPRMMVSGVIVGSLGPRMSNCAEPIIRCPYCRLGNEFRPMTLRIEGWLQCENCGHNTMPMDPEFKCTCSKCAPAQPTNFPGSL